mmetsp:Transcript_21343/g.32524  ORF Transcript_21343/g.32524 Transcript_21343/m.32524 type:complete len:260 (-) Transcript_21343:820-1599(-)
MCSGSMFHHHIFILCICSCSCSCSSMDAVVIIMTTPRSNPGNLLGPSKLPLCSIGTNGRTVHRLHYSLHGCSNDATQCRTEIGRQCGLSALFAASPCCLAGTYRFHRISFDVMICGFVLFCFQTNCRKNWSVQITTPLRSPGLHVPTIAASTRTGLMEADLMPRMIAGLEAGIAEHAGTVRLTGTAVPRHIAAFEHVPARSRRGHGVLRQMLQQAHQVISVVSIIAIQLVVMQYHGIGPHLDLIGGHTCEGMVHRFRQH